ncbi:MAG TPA: XdhC/CoxI family protein [Acidimicrobiales bacterium]|nr:XdhC/CoxI family protein [Acidimicrobiales bacterium]
MSDADPSPEAVLELVRRIGRGEPVVLATAVRTFGSPPCEPGNKLLLGPGGPLAGTLGCAELDDQAAGDAMLLLDTGQPVVRSYDHDLGRVEAYLEPYRPRARLVVLGATPVARWLLRWGRDLGYETVLIEDRGARITPEHRAEAGSVLPSPKELSPRQPTDVVHTDHDAPELAEHLSVLLRAGARFVGVMGSRRHTAHHIEALRALGIGETDVTRIRTPVGLDIGARGAEEIALSILAGLVADPRGRDGGWLDRP